MLGKVNRLDSSRCSHSSLLTPTSRLIIECKLSCTLDAYYAIPIPNPYLIT